MEYLSDIELYYSPLVQGGQILIEGEEMNHIIRVMRHQKGDNIFVTDGSGKIYKTGITDIIKNHISVSIREVYQYENTLSRIFFCIPKLKNPERFEFALEKCTELGITNFIIYEPLRALKKGDKKERWEKIIVSAMKQSLRSYKPQIYYAGGLKGLKFEGQKIVFDQNAENYFNKEIIKHDQNYIFIFGPEGGLDERELPQLSSAEIFKISPNRLRSETAIIKAASLL